MNNAKKQQLIKKALGEGQGVLRLVPAWVPRSFMIPGRRLKLANEDLYALGAKRGGINERWLASTTNADNGPETPQDEGLSYIAVDDSIGICKILLKEAIDLLGNELIGSELMDTCGGWQVLTKFFDNLGPIPHHVHQMDEHASLVGKLGKPEAYYFPKQLNAVANNFPYTFFGLNPGTTKEQVIDCLRQWDNGDNGILDISRAYRLKPGTGWKVPAGLLHAPGSLVTYELQCPYDIFGMFQSLVDGRLVPRDLLVKDVPEKYHYDYEYLVSMLDWEANTDPNLTKNRFVQPIQVKDGADTESIGYEEKWVVYGSDKFCAKELTVLPGRSVTVTDSAPYGVILLQGCGTIGNVKVNTSTRIKYGELTDDEVFVTMDAARCGVTISNYSSADELVMLKHFSPGNSDMPVSTDK